MCIYITKKKREKKVKGISTPQKIKSSRTSSHISFFGEEKEEEGEWPGGKEGQVIWRRIDFVLVTLKKKRKKREEKKGKKKEKKRKKAKQRKAEKRREEKKRKIMTQSQHKDYTSNPALTEEVCSCRLSRRSVSLKKISNNLPGLTSTSRCPSSSSSSSDSPSLMNSQCVPKSSGSREGGMPVEES